ncbi:DUF2796 domain-containing protein [Pigmentibacter sp. JX0631]|uniref:ZrgA family zinc uptake protein n=1 Tax=Pigmentibacter sp. JX0631 TaxID=2976982 RepID=UPI0024693D51|nr:DUF2796 domain-containing protein [Pigmentibacter sp. JX0631]WGL59769.1 DUF2796 domain-containing protein [Pigmentibacter sp. JX0631]
MIKICIKLIVISTLFISPIATYSSYTKNQKLGTAHHNKAEVDIAIGLFNSKKVNIQIRIPAKEAYGFEGKSQTAEQDEKVRATDNIIREKISQIIAFPKEANCKYEIEEIENFEVASEKFDLPERGERKKGDVSYWILKADVNAYCNRVMDNQKVNIDFSKDFKEISKIFVTLIGDKKRKMTIHKPYGEVYL